MSYNKWIAYIGLTALILFLVYFTWSIIKKFNEIKIKLKYYIANNKHVFIIFLIFMLLYIPCFFFLFKSDSNVYYTTVHDNIGKWDFTMETVKYLQMGYHMSYGYSIFIYLGEAIIRLWGIGIRISNLLIFFITLICLNGIAKELFPNKDKWFYSFVIMMFAFNPLILGIIQELNLDYAIVCFFIWFIWAFQKKYKIYIVFFAALMCLSKENAIVILAGFMIGAVVFRMFHIKKPISIKKIFKCINNEEWAMFFAASAVAVNSILLNGQWGKTGTVPSGNKNVVNTIQFNADYIAIKLKQMFVLNFQWLVVGIAFLLFLILIIKRIKIMINETGYALIVSFLVNVLFQLAFFTYPHYRYLQVNALYFSMAIAYLLYRLISNKIVADGCMMVIVAVFFVQSFYSIDFITNAISRKVPTGNGQINSEAYYSDVPGKNYVLALEKDGGNLINERYRDYVQNNRQYLGFEVCFEKLMKGIGYNENKSIVLSPLYGNLDYTIVNMFGTPDKKKLMWNRKFSQITYENSDIAINWIDINNIEDAFKYYDEIWYVELPCENKPNFPEVSKYISEDEKQEYKFMGWKLIAYKLKK